MLLECCINGCWYGCMSDLGCRVRVELGTQVGRYMYECMGWYGMDGYGWVWMGMG